MSTHQIHVFISHSWSYSGYYDTLSSWIFGQSWRFGQASIKFLDYSVPRDDPIHNAPTQKALQEAIYAKIARTHVVVIPTGMYTNYSKWIQKEILDQTLTKNRFLRLIRGDSSELHPSCLARLT